MAQLASMKRGFKLICEEENRAKEKKKEGLHQTMEALLV